MDKSEKVFHEIHTDIPREGPGDDKSTRQAFKLCKDLPPYPNILDVGCGPGLQTLELARISDGTIYAIDLYDKYLAMLNNSIKKGKFKAKIRTENMSLFDIKYEHDFFDLLWAEGVIFIPGFREGLQICKKFVKKGGYIAITELTWLTNQRPKEIQKYIQSQYPKITTIKGYEQIVNDCDLSLESQFTIPESSWYDNYYIPMEKRIKKLMKKYAKDKIALEVLLNEQLEIDMYRKYSKYYGYVFYIIRK